MPLLPLCDSLMSKATRRNEHLRTVGWEYSCRLLARSAENGFALWRRGIFHFIFRKRFLSISMNHGKASNRDECTFLGFPLLRFLRLRGYFVVAIAGVLLVFCYLIVPALVHALAGSSAAARHRRTMGTLVSALGCYLSVIID